MIDRCSEAAHCARCASPPSARGNLAHIGLLPHLEAPPFPTGVVPRARTTANTPEPDPVANDKPAVWPLVMCDMAGRDKFGREKYGTPLQPHNGRDALTDAYQEVLDLAVYLRTVIFERDGK